MKTNIINAQYIHQIVELEQNNTLLNASLTVFREELQRTFLTLMECKCQLDLKDKALNQRQDEIQMLTKKIAVIEEKKEC
ncbi:hypothetical protein [Chromobacterium haemolyticum]|uniref:hypothetical protein n=1 Tax=Chromobacterium haemolyticum TaxID=394935 RepID=UPI0009D99952|nr:hypothetical protein [Chromobacterium haemolyticum]OQS31370.1 hypothetical protein B0T39_24285 [Chromobacterium haemolyticum]